jgi:hypothetical protein
MGISYCKGLHALPLLVIYFVKKIPLGEIQGEPITRCPPRALPLPHYLIVLRLFDTSRRQAPDKPKYPVPVPG